MEKSWGQSSFENCQSGSLRVPFLSYNLSRMVFYYKREVLQYSLIFSLTTCTKVNKLKSVFISDAALKIQNVNLGAIV